MANPLYNTEEPIFNARLLSELSRRGKGVAIDIPHEFVPTDENRPAVRHDEWIDIDLPVVDFADEELDELTLAHKLRNAATEWGFFYFTNHGVPTEVIHEVQEQGRQFFALPLEEKEKISLPELMGYRGDHRGVGHKKLMWSEALMISSHPQSTMVEMLAQGIWPDGNSEFCNALKKYWTAVNEVKLHILRLLAKGLGLEEHFFSQHFTKESPSNDLFRWNCYPTCPRPLEVLGAHGHTDTGVMTILYDDGMGGLQVCKGGEWIGVKPIKGALICQFGDFMQVWTNGIVKATEHRVVVNDSQARLSMASFFYPGDQTVLSAPSSLVEDCNQIRLYKPLQYGEFIAHFRNILLTGKFPDGMGIVNEHFANGHGSKPSAKKPHTVGEALNLLL